MWPKINKQQPRKNISRQAEFMHPEELLDGAETDVIESKTKRQRIFPPVAQEGIFKRNQSMFSQNTNEFKDECIVRTSSVPTGLKKSDSYHNLKLEIMSQKSQEFQDLSQKAQKIIESVEDILSKDQFCFQYYHKKYKDARMHIIKKLFKSLTSRWRENFVIYPLSSTQEIQFCM